VKSNSRLARSPATPLLRGRLDQRELNVFVQRIEGDRQPERFKVNFAFGPIFNELPVVMCIADLPPSRSSLHSRDAATEADHPPS